MGTQHDGPGRAFSPFYATLDEILYGNFAFSLRNSDFILFSVIF